MNGLSLSSLLNKEVQETHRLFDLFVNFINREKQHAYSTICVYLWVHYTIIYLTHIFWSSISNTALKHNRAASMLHCLITVKKSLRLLDLLSILVYTICIHNVHICFIAKDIRLPAPYSIQWLVVISHSSLFPTYTADEILRFLTSRLKI